MAWRGGCVAAELVPGAVRQYCLGGCSTLREWAWRSWQLRSEVPVLILVSHLPPSLFLSHAPCGACGLDVPFPQLLVHHSRWSVRSWGSVRLPLECALRVCGVFVRLR